VSITMQPRPAVQLGDHYGPQPRKFVGESVETAPLAAPPEGAGAP
jgi:hypothetical protein